MRIVQAITLGETGGAQSNVRDLLQHGASRHDVALITGLEGTLTDFARSIGVDVYIVKELGRNIELSDDVAAYHAIKRHLLTIAPDIAHFHSSKAGFLGRLAAWNLKIPSVFTAHGWGFKPGVPVRRRLMVWLSEWIAARTGSKIICVSKYDYDLAIRYRVASPHQMSIVKNGVANVQAPLDLIENVYSQRRRRYPTRKVMTMVARFQEPKDQSTLIGSLVSITKSVDCELWLIGSGPQLQRAKQLCHDLKLIDRVIFWDERNDVHHALRQTDLFVLLSRYEGLPISILEAMQAGIPVAASRVGGVPELVDDGQTGVLIAPDASPTEVARVLIRLLQNPERMQTCGAAGALRAEREFGLSDMLVRIEDIYQNLLKERGSV